MAPAVAAGSAPDAPNGTTASDADRFAAFYDQILKLQDTIITGKHPHIKLPQYAIKQLSAPIKGSTVPPYSASQPLTNGLSNGTHAPSPLSKTNDLSHTVSGSFAANQQPPAAAGYSIDNDSRPTKSSIDPVLLTKSDDLVRAEIQLKRQRIERALKEQAETQRSMQPRDKDAALESTLDVGEVLKAALDLVKPISGLRLAANHDKADSSASFDTNSYYSSQVNDWSSEDADSANNGKAAVGVPEASKLPGIGIIDLEAMDDTVVVHEAPKPAQSTRIPGLQKATESEPNAREDVHLYDDLEEGQDEPMDESDEYSPPPPDTYAPVTQEEEPILLPPAATTAPAAIDLAGLGIPSRVPVAGPEYNRPTSPGSPRLRVVRNHITSPIAPQPSRVSPLAVAKLPRLEKAPINVSAQAAQATHPSPRVERTGFGNAQTNGGRGRRPSPQRSGRQSPQNGQQKVNNPRKRRRENDRPNNQRKGSGKRVARSPPPPTAPLPQQQQPLSPVPIIKDEPLSPAPLARIPDVPQIRQRPVYERPQEVVDLSPREPRSIYVRDEPHPQRPLYAHEREELPSPGYVRVASRLGHGRDEPDLRRVASLQYARRPQSPGMDAVHPLRGEPQRQYRAASHAYVELPREQAALRQQSVRPITAQYVRAESPPSTDPMRINSPLTMAPPPAPARKIMVDEYGNKFYAEPVPMDTRASMAPPLRQMEYEPYYERASTRAPAYREPGRSLNPYDQEYMTERMLPPPPPQRRYNPDVEMVEAPAYRRRQYSTLPVDMLPAGEEYLAARESRRPASPYDVAPLRPPFPSSVARDYPPRAYSVRPDVVRREGPMEYMPRHESVAPRQAMREVSVHARGYGHVAGEPVRYTYAPSSQSVGGQMVRYVDERGMEVMMDRPVEAVDEGYGERTRYRY